MGIDKNVIVEIDGGKFECSSSAITIFSDLHLVFVGHVSLLSNQIYDKSILYRRIFFDKFYRELFNSDSIAFTILDNLNPDDLTYERILTDVDFLIVDNQEWIESIKKQKIPVLNQSNYNTFNIKDLKKRNICVRDVEYDYMTIIEER